MRGFVRALAAVATIAAGLYAAKAAAHSGDFTDMSLEELMDVEVTVVSRQPQKASEAAAAVFVLTNEDIRRAGVTNIPDALRLVPGVEVARINANTWAISIRGFNSRFANKLLVMIDGRSIYTPLFSGVFWDRHDVMLADIDRIEVIRGPGAALWGANAVNGVINIITRDSRDTQGNFAEGTVGTVERGMAQLRHGGELGESTTYRAYAQGRLRDSGKTEDGRDGADEWTSGLIGFRSDTALGRDDLQLQGQFQRSNMGELADIAILTPPFSELREIDTNSSGGHLLGRWSRDLGVDSQLSLQGYFDHRRFRDSRIAERRSTFDLELQHSFRPAPRHEIVWGLGYRHTRDEIDNSFSVTFEPESRNIDLWSGFVQDTIAIVDNELDLVLGTKLEYNDYTGFEIQPNARALWRPLERHTFWASVSRAVRTPSRAENDVTLNSAVLPPSSPQNPQPLPALVSFRGSKDAESERLVAYELGYRTRPQDWISLDLTAFYNHYDNLRALEQQDTFFEADPTSHLVVPLVLDNAMEADTYGFEVVSNIQLRPEWRLQATYALLQIDARVPDNIDPDQARQVEGASPQQQASLRSIWDVTRDVRFDATVRFVDALPAFDVDAYTQLDARLAWKPTDSLELAVVGRNLLRSDQREFGSENLFLARTTRAERGAFVTLSARF